LRLKCFFDIFPSLKSSILKAKNMDIEQLIADLLADRAPLRARDFTLAWEEHRNSSWVDAARDAETRAGSDGHIPQIRGQLRYHLGEVAIANAAHRAGAGVIPLRTQPPGGIFNIARVGRFALVSVTVRYPSLLPRRSITRRLLSQPNEAIDPILELPLDPKGRKVVTDLAYLGCLCAVPKASDPTVPEILALGVPNVGLSGWIAWTPLYRLQALLQERADAFSKGIGAPETGVVPDLAFPTFRVPKHDVGEDDQES
jgi:hypothetical protein